MILIFSAKLITSEPSIDFMVLNKKKAFISLGHGLRHPVLRATLSPTTRRTSACTKDVPRITSESGELTAARLLALAEFCFQEQAKTPTL